MIDGLIYKADLVTGQSIIIHPELQHLNVHKEPLQYMQSTNTWKGLLRITLPPATGIGGVQNRALKFKLTFDTPESALGFPSFHIGDSVDNAVDGSDYTEIVNDGTTLKVHAANHQGPDFSDKVGFINVYSGMDVLIGHEFIEAVSGTQIENYCSTSGYLFSLSRSTDYDIFFAMNRLISQPGSLGKGLHFVEIFAATCYVGKK